MTGFIGVWVTTDNMEFSTGWFADFDDAYSAYCDDPFNLAADGFANIAFRGVFSEEQYHGLPHHRAD